ncbi:hypothetical protein [Methylocaldum gracile]|jgi:O-succinylbenzoate synthase|uniref:hypothetical protein n=1 Tax=Methylocaldum sp. 0917 TaxID=2485163 RepID=UPI0010608A15
MTDDKSKIATLGEILNDNECRYPPFSDEISRREYYVLKFKDQFLADVADDLGKNIDDLSAAEWRDIAEALIAKLADLDLNLDAAAEAGRGLFEDIKKYRKRDKDRIAYRQDQIDKRAFQKALLSNIDSYVTISEAIRDLRIKPRFQNYPDKTMRIWANKVWTKPKKRGRPRKK